MIDMAPAGSPTVPGLLFRHYRGEEDLPAMLRVYTAAHEADGVEEVTNLEQLTLNYATLVNCDPARDIVLAEVDGSVVAYARVFWTDLVEGGRSYENFGFVHPDWRRRGIGGAMHRQNEARLREIASEHADVSPKWFGSEGPDTDAGNAALLLGNGYRAIRFFFEMVARTLDGIKEHPMPHGIELRPVTREQYRTIWLADAEAFRRFRPGAAFGPGTTDISRSTCSRPRRKRPQAACTREYRRTRRERYGRSASTRSRVS